METTLIILAIWFSISFSIAGFTGRYIRYGMTGELPKREEYEYEPQAPPAWGK